MKNYKVLASTSCEELAESLGVDKSIMDTKKSFGEIVSMLDLREYFYSPMQVLHLTGDEFFNNHDIQSKVVLICSLPSFKALDDRYYNYAVEFGYSDIGDGDELICTVRAVQADI